MASLLGAWTDYPRWSYKSARVFQPDRWQFATAAATGTADITTTVVSTGIAAADWEISESITTTVAATCIAAAASAAQAVCHRDSR